VSLSSLVARANRPAVALAGDVPIEVTIPGLPVDVPAAGARRVPAGGRGHRNRLCERMSHGRR